MSTRSMRPPLRPLLTHSRQGDVPPDEITGVTLGEIVRALGDLREEIRALRSEHVRRDLYEAHRAETQAEMRRLESQIQQRDEERAREVRARDEERAREVRDRTSGRRQISLTAVTAVVSLIVALITLTAHH
jgi:hypothetical protein